MVGGERGGGGGLPGDDLAADPDGWARSVEDHVAGDLGRCEQTFAR